MKDDNVKIDMEMSLMTFMKLQNLVSLEQYRCEQRIDSAIKRMETLEESDVCQRANLEEVIESRYADIITYKHITNLISEGSTL